MLLSELVRKFPRKSLAFIIVLNILLHLPFINLPPCSIHVWRQCNTLAVTRNYYEEDSNILHPRVDRRGTTDGITGMQFPAYEWALSRLYFITGETNYTARLFSLAFSSCALFFLFFFLKEVSRDSFFALAGTWCLAWSPEFYYQGINALPDIAAFTSTLAAAYLFMRWTHRGGRRLYLLTFLFLTLGGLIKIQYFMITAFMAGTLWMMRNQFPAKFFRERLASFLAMSVVSGGIIVSWYIRARYMIATSGLTDFGLEIRSAESWSGGLAILQRNLISDFPELLINYGGLILILSAFLLLRKKQLMQRPASGGFLLLSIAYLIYHLLELHQMRIHHYYMLPSLLFLMPLAGAGLVLLYQHSKLRWLAILLIVASPVLATVRIVPARWWRDDLGIPKELTDKIQLQRLIKVVPDTALVIVGPDPSGCIFLYFLHKKGYCYDDPAEINNGSALPLQYKKAVYLYSYRKEITNPGAQLLDSVGQWRIYQLTQPTRN